MKCGKLYQFAGIKLILVKLKFLFLLFASVSTQQYQNFLRYETTCSWLYRGNPEDCNTYFQCNHGAALLRSCPSTLFWNVDIMNCDWPRNVRSGQDCRDPTREQHGEIEVGPIGQPDNGGLDNSNGVDSEDTVIIDNAVRSRCEEGSMMPNIKDCRTFYVCNHGSNLLQQCGPGLHWNPSVNTCDWPNQARCGSSGTVFPTTSSTPYPSSSSTTGRPLTFRPTSSKPSTLTPSTMSSTSRPILPTGEKVVCYFTDWAWYRQGIGKYMPANIDYTLCTHIVYAFAVLDESSWSIKPADTWADYDNKFYEQVTSLKSHGLKVTLALGGWNDSGGDKYSQLVKDIKKRAIFVESVVEYLRKYNFDGIDLDWEYPRCPQGNCGQGLETDKEGFAALIREVRLALPQGAIISVAVSANKNIVDVAYDVPSLSRDLDWIGVMNYDYHGGWETKTGHIAPLYFNSGDQFDYLNVNYSMNYWIEKGAPRSKLVMGIPLYGQSFTLVNPVNNKLNAKATGPGQAGTFTRQGGILAYYEICSQNWQITQNPKGTMGPYGVNGNQWVSFDDIAMVKKKSEYIKSMGLGGAMIWALDFDDFIGSCGGGRYPILTAISSSLRTNSEFS